MNANDFAANVIARLTGAYGTPCAPWLLVERTIFTPAQVLAMTDEQLRDYPDKVCNRLWSFRGYSEPGRDCQDPSVWLFTKDDWEPYVELPIVMFWPPFRPGAPVEFVWAYGEDEAILAAVVWLVQQPLEPYNGPRMVCTAYDISGYTKWLIKPTLLTGDIDDESG